MRIRKIISAILQKVGYTSFKDLTINELTSDATLYYVNENGQEVYVKYPNTNPTPVNSVCKLALELYQTKSALTWLDNTQTINTWDGNNLMESITQKNGWNINYEGWFSYDKWIYTYDSNNNLSSRTYQQTDSAETSEIWSNIEQYLYLYDGNNLLFETYQKWYDEISFVLGWTNICRTGNTWLSNNLITSASQTWSKDLGDWLNEVQTLYTYIGNNISTETYQNWVSGELARQKSPTTTGWTSVSQLIYEYSGNNLTTKTYIAWDTESGAKCAWGDLTITVKPISGDTITIDSVTFEFGTAGSVSPGNIPILGDEHTIYIMNSHLTNVLVSTDDGSVLFISARIAGTAGNSIEISSSIGILSGPTLTGGSDGVAAATGSIFVNGDASYGDIIIIDSITFEVSPDETALPGNIPIPISGNTIDVMNSALTNVTVSTTNASSLLITANKFGSEGNLIGISSTWGVVSGPTLEGGSDGTWTNREKNVYTYNGNKLLTDIYQTWDNYSVIVGWVNGEQFIYTYDGNNLSSKTYQYWISDDPMLTGWISISQYLYTYDSNNNLLTEIGQNWIDVQTGWTNQRQYSFTYDSNNNRISFVDKSFDINTATGATGSLSFNLTQATVALYIDGRANAGDTFTIGSEIYEFITDTGGTYDPSHILIDLTMDLSLSSIINDNSIIVRSGRFGILEAIIPGESGNDIAVSSTTTGITFSSPTLIGGSGSLPVDGDTMTIDSVTFEFGTIETVSPGNIPISIGKDTINIINSALTNVTVSSSDNTGLLFEAKEIGTSGNLIEISSTFGIMSGPTLTGGSDGWYDLDKYTWTWLTGCSKCKIEPPEMHVES